jgi:ABC-2 type transport system ATP-binding protein
MLKINNLYKSYSENVVINQLNHSFEKGTVYGIVGKNGSGKTSFFKCIAGLEKYNGDVLYNNKPLLRSTIGYLSTDPYFFPLITGFEFLKFLEKTDNHHIDIEKLNKYFNLPLNKLINTYSSGMRKKLAFMGIVPLNKEIYLLDEPFNSLDLESVLLFKKIIVELKQKGKIIIISSHILESLYDISDSILYLYNGTFIKEYLKPEFKEIEKNIKATLFNEDSIIL